MKVLLDECVPRKLKQDLAGHEVSTVPEMGWSGIKNGALLRLAESSFDVFVTLDRNLQYQQNLKATKFAIIVLKVADNRIEALHPLMSRVLNALEVIHAGELIQIVG